MHLGGRSWQRAAPIALAFALVVAATAADAADLTVSAAASLGDAFRDIGRAFESANPGTKVQLNFAASGALSQQIAGGAPVDVFAGADEETVDRAEQQQLIQRGSRVDFAVNTLVVVVPGDAASLPKALADLAAPAIRRIAIGLPVSVPAGRYARTALVKADPPVRYPIAIVAGSGNPSAAQGFVAFVASPAGQPTLAPAGLADRAHHPRRRRCRRLRRRGDRARWRPRRRQPLDRQRTGFSNFLMSSAAAAVACASMAR